ncbi:MAG: multi-sensor signal transduction histidine kinase [Armatimonadetes bacterium]|jgi:two-component system phosphate regulon sensor histidine kinase PhoR|nr:multi-sensor signal transduction histidine kinase [Armatimonadota bacterium]
MSFRTLFLWYVAAAALVPLLALGLFLVQGQETAGRAALDRELFFEASVARQLLDGRPPAEVRQRLLHPDSHLPVRLTILTLEGEVVADSSADPRQMENHLRRPEVQQALRLGTGVAERHSDTVNDQMRYLAIVQMEDPKARIYRAAVPLTMLRNQIRQTQWTIGAAVGVALLFALAAANRLARQVVGPVEALSTGAQRFSEGEPNPRVLPDGPDALYRLGLTFNTMVDRIESQVHSLAEAQGYLDAVIRQMPEGLLVLDGAGLVTRANPAAERLLELSAARILGRPILGVLLSYPLDTEVRRVLSGAATGAVDVATTNRRSLRVSVGALSIQGELSGAVVLLQDISELRRADEMRRDFVANVSHELRTPIAAIRALVETLILRGDRRPELLGQYGPRIVDECERIDQLVNDLLLLAQTESGQLHLDPVTLDPAEVADEVLRLVQLANEGGPALCLDRFEGGAVYADRSSLSQCLRNLVDNAVRYAPDGTVRLGSRREGDQVVLYVADEGPGIPAEDLPRIFERFYRVDKARSREVGGSGLGLSIVRHLIEAQGGRAWAESREDAGTTFYLSLPAAGAGDY